MPAAVSTVADAQVCTFVAVSAFVSASIRENRSVLTDLRNLSGLHFGRRVRSDAERDHADLFTQGLSNAAAPDCRTADTPDDASRKSTEPALMAFSWPERRTDR